MIEIEVNDKVYEVKLAITEQDKEDGLQNVEKLAENAGMLFVYDEPQTVSFWMADTLLDLDIIFISEDEEVIKIVHGHAGSEEPHVCDNVKYVLEVNVKSGIRAGDEVDLSELDSEDELEDDVVPKSIDEAVMEVLDAKGNSQMDLVGGERIFSRKHTKTLVRFAKKAYKSKLDKDYKALGRKVFQYINYQDNKEDDFVEIK